MKIYIASDHAGFDLKSKLQTLKTKVSIQWIDLGPSTDDRVDYPDYANRLCEQLLQDQPGVALGVLICGSGVGVSIAANRYANIRAVLAESPAVAKLGREHNHANVLCLGARILTSDQALQILDAFLTAAPDMGERHVHRIQLLGQKGNAS